MQRFFLVAFILLILATSGFGQKFSSVSGTISFFSDAPVEDISATNTSVASLFDAASGDIVFMVPIKDFLFEKRLMREHFNEKYLETHKFPKASFNGRVTGFAGTKPGAQSVTVEGKLTIHGVTKDIRATGNMEITGGKLLAKSKFVIKLADYNISVPQIVWQNIAEEIKIKVDFIYKPI